MSKEHEVFSLVFNWKPNNVLLRPEEIFKSKNSFFSLYKYLYVKIKETYSKLPRRKNGEDPFFHPLNVVHFLKRAKVNDEITLAAALMHDLIEEEVDQYQKELQLKENDKAKQHLDVYEKLIYRELEKDLYHFCEQENIPKEIVKEIIRTVLLLTRHKRHFYYTSIATIFSCEDAKLKERAIQIKLADRLHNILTIENFNERERIHQCFKNIFVLNNVKKYFLTNFGAKIFHYAHFSSTEKLFTKCCKATYNAFLTICHLSAGKGIQEVRSTLQLAFKKYAFEISGLWEVTKLNKEEVHPIRLFQGVVRKYDHRLHLEWEKFQKRIQNELEYCNKIFSDYNFNQEQLQAIIDYKDAYSLKEVIARLLYNPDYVVGRFLCSELSPKGRIIEKDSLGLP